MEFSELLIGLASEFKIPPLEVDSLGYCSLDIDEMPLLLYAPPQEGAVALIAHVGVVDPQDFERLEELLAANFKGTGTGNGHLMVDVNNNILLVQWLPLTIELKFSQFFMELEHFVNYQEFWSKRLSTSRHAHASSNSSLQAVLMS